MFSASAAAPATPAFGRVISGMEFVDKLKKGAPGSGVVDNPDIIISLRSSK